MAAGSLVARRGIGGGACTKIGVDLGDGQFGFWGASMSLAVALFDALEAASSLATRLLPFGAVVCGLVHAPRWIYPHRSAEKVRDLGISFRDATTLITTFLRAHHVQVQS